MTKRIDITDYGAVSGGEVLCTTAIQSAIDEAAELEGEVYLPKGIYLTGALFLKNNMSLHLAKDAVLVGTTDKEAYPIKQSCASGGETDCSTGLINVFETSHVRVRGAGTIDSQMPNVIVHGCRDVQLKDLTCVHSGLGSVHVCYSENVVVTGLTIRDSQSAGIVIDSCNGLLTEKCRISCSDDNVCIKAGRDAKEVHEDCICENIMVRDCEIHEGLGITLESNGSGKMRNISVCDNVFKNTRCGFCMKSVMKRGGFIEDVEVTNLKMEDVSCCFCFEGQRVSEEKEFPRVGNVRISKVSSVIGKSKEATGKAFSIKGFAEVPFEDVLFEDVCLRVKEYGSITNVKNLKFVDVCVNVG